MTKVDEACPLVAEDLKNVYHSVYIQKKVTYWKDLHYVNKSYLEEWCYNFLHVYISFFQARELSESLGIPLSCVLPVKNYSEELDLDQDTDILMFTAVEQMLNYADSFFENQVIEDQEPNDQLELYRSSELLRSDQKKIIWKTEHQFPNFINPEWVSHLIRFIRLNAIFI